MQNWKSKIGSKNFVPKKILTRIHQYLNDILVFADKTIKSKLIVFNVFRKVVRQYLHKDVSLNNYQVCA